VQWYFGWNVLVIFVEIGGYFSPILQCPLNKLNGKLIGAVEDTEFGHRSYEQLGADD